MLEEDAVLYELFGGGLCDRGDVTIAAGVRGAVGWGVAQGLVLPFALAGGVDAAAAVPPWLRSRENGLVLFSAGGLTAGGETTGVETTGGETA